MATRDGFEIPPYPPPLAQAQGVTVLFGNVAVYSEQYGYERGYEEGYSDGSLVAPTATDDAVVAFTAFSITAPLDGLTPVWLAYYDAETGDLQTEPEIEEVGDGSYKFTPTGTQPAGMIDLGSDTAVPRYLVFNNSTTHRVFGAFDIDKEPLTALTPDWLSLKKVSDNSDYTPQPDIEELGFGLYRVGFIPEHTTGVIDLGATAYPRLYHYDSELSPDYESGYADGLLDSPHIEITATPVVETTDTDAIFSFTISTGDAEYSLDGGAFVAATSPISLADLALGEHEIIIRSVDVPTNLQSFTWTVSTGSGGSTTGNIISITHGTLGRWTPVIARVQITGGVPFIRYVSEDLSFWIYDSVDGFKNNFRDRSSIVLDGDVYTITVLPNGGWWTNKFSLKFVAGVELEQE